QCGPNSWSFSEVVLDNRQQKLSGKLKNPLEQVERIFCFCNNALASVALWPLFSKDKAGKIRILRKIAKGAAHIFGVHDKICSGFIRRIKGNIVQHPF